MANRLLMPFLCPQLITSPRAVASLPLLRPLIATRHASDARSKTKAKKKGRKDFKCQPLDESMQFALCDAIRYIKAIEVGRSPKSVKYDLAIKLRSLKNGPVVRDSVRLPHAIDVSIRTCVICPPGSIAETEAKNAGAVMTGEHEVFDSIKAGNIDFDRCLCHPDSLIKLNVSGVARILGPKGLMPSQKMGTVTKNITGMMSGMRGGVQYRERNGVVRCVVGMLANTPEEMQANIKAFMTKIKGDLTGLSDQMEKSVYEVVLSSTNAPGFSLNGDFRSDQSLPTESLKVS